MLLLLLYGDRCNSFGLWQDTTILALVMRGTCTVLGICMHSTGIGKSEIKILHVKKFQSVCIYKTYMHTYVGTTICYTSMSSGYVSQEMLFVCAAED